PGGIVSLAPDKDEGIWLGLFGDLARYRRGQAETIAFPHDQYARVRQVLPLPNGSVLGATASGLIAWKDGKTQKLTVKNGLPCETVHALVLDKQQTLWLYADCGLLEITNNELGRWWNDEAAVLKVTSFDVFDGAWPAAAAFQPRASLGPDG